VQLVPSHFLVSATDHLPPHHPQPYPHIQACFWSEALAIRLRVEATCCSPWLCRSFFTTAHPLFDLFVGAHLASFAFENLESVPLIAKLSSWHREQAASLHYTRVKAVATHEIRPTRRSIADPFSRRDNRPPLMRTEITPVAIIVTLAHFSAPAAPAPAPATRYISETGLGDPRNDRLTTNHFRRT
jgi:hypothetical protein